MGRSTLTTGGGIGTNIKAASTALLFDNPEGSFMGDFTQTGTVNYTLVAGNNVIGSWIHTRFISNGVSPVNFSAAFDSLSGVGNGQVLSSGRHDFWFVFKDNGKVNLTVTSNASAGA